ncbi:MAG: PEP-CTERM sorting domain-containing protein [Pirellulales bacterium]|nr:PEP-CTERM sorting domain-containing protein [Pirellulales bacterium]
MSRRTYCQVLGGLLVAALAVGAVPAAAEMVSADFTAGNTTTEVDGYAGVAGDGWATAWVKRSTSGLTATATVLTAEEGTELKEGLGNFLYVTANREGSTGHGGGVIRSYKTSGMDPIDWTKTHTICFTVRIDEDVDAEGAFTDAEDRYMIHDRSTNAAVQSDGTASFMISGAPKNIDESNPNFPTNVAGEWTFYNGLAPEGSSTFDKTRQVDTNIALHTDHVYDFTIVTDPETQTYDATVTDVTASLSFTAYDLGWRTLATEIPGYLCFGGRDGASTTGDTRQFSLDAVTIVPEPSTFLMLMGALAAMSVATRGRRDW